MGYFEEKKEELEALIRLIEREEQSLETLAKEEKDHLTGIRKSLRKLEFDIKQLAKERQQGFPWLAKAYGELFKIRDQAVSEHLLYKKPPAVKAAEVVKEQSRLRRQAQREKKIAQYLVEYYESIAPFLVDLKTEVDAPTEADQRILRDYSDDEREDEVIDYLTKEEYRKLSTVERNQLALDRFLKIKKSRPLIGRMYERYVGYLYEQDGYDVEYVGIFKGLEDLGRDLICRKEKEFVIVQCKNWAKFRTIYEKHIFQFFGTVFKYKDDNPKQEVKGVFYTSTKLSKLARRFASELGIELKENESLDRNYPCIKCNVSRVDRSKIYHLPFDQQYDRTKIEKHRGEFYCRTVREAEDAGFRRAFRYKGGDKKSGKGSKS